VKCLKSRVEVSGSGFSVEKFLAPAADVVVTLKNPSQEQHFPSKLDLGWHTCLTGYVFLQ
jgi:hypothetical protein